MKTCDDMTALGKLGDALAKAQGEFGRVEKNAKNPHLRNRYADLASVMTAVSPALAAHGLGIVGSVDGEAKGATLTTRLIHAGGGWVEVTMPVVWEPGKGVNIAQSFGGGLTYARRYAVMTLLGLAPEDEDDGCSAGPMDRGRQQPQHHRPPQAQAKRGPSPAQPKAQAAGDETPTWVHPKASRLYRVALEHGAKFCAEKQQATPKTYAAVVEAMGRTVDELVEWRHATDKGVLDTANVWHVGGSLMKFLAGECDEFAGWAAAQKGAA